MILLSSVKATVSKRSDLRPRLSDLPHDSLERETDTITLVWPEYYGINVDEQGNSTEGLTEVIIAKNEFGPCGTVELGYLPESDRFLNIGKTAHVSEDSPPDDAPW